MRGSPLLRVFFVAILLACAGWGLHRLLHRPAGHGSVTGGLGTVAAVAVSAGEQVSLEVPYRLVLSSPARRLQMECAGEVVTGLEGRLRMPKEGAAIFLQVDWENGAPEPEHHFAKLILEIPGRETLEKVFDAPGAIEDVWEVE